MPIRVLLHGNVWFEPEDIEKLTTAFELALSKLDGGAKRLRLRLFSIAGQLVTTVRRRTPPLSTHAPGMQLAL